MKPYLLGWKDDLAVFGITRRVRVKPYLARVAGRSCRLWENTEGTSETVPGSGGRTILPSLGEHGGYGINLSWFGWQDDFTVFGRTRRVRAKPYLVRVAGRSSVFGRTRRIRAKPYLVRVEGRSCRLWEAGRWRRRSPPCCRLVCSWPRRSPCRHA